MAASNQLKFALFYCLLVLLPALSNGQRIHNYYPSDYGGGPNIYSIAKDSDGILYLANNKGILKFDGSSWEILELSNFSEGRTVISDPSGKIYATGDGQFGFLEKDSSGNSIYKSISDNLKRPISFKEVWQVIFSQEKVYFQSYEGIFVWDQVSLEFIDIPDAYVFSGFGQIYVSQFETGIGSLAQKKFELISPIRNQDAVFQFFQLDQDRILMPTAYSGFYILRKSHSDSQEVIAERYITAIDSLVEKYGFYDGIQIKNTVYALGTWEGGLIFHDFDKNWTQRITTKEGLISNGINALEIGPLGELWIGTDNGISVIDLDSLTPTSLAPVTTLLTRVTANHDSVLFSGSSSYPGSFLSQPAQIWGTENSILINFTTPGWDFKSHDNFSYRLEGYESEWSEWVSTPQKEYTNLNPGNYLFQVKSRLPGGIDNNLAQFKFQINYVWYQTNWAYATLVLTVLGIAGWIIRRYTDRLHKTKTKLEHLVDERTIELSGQKTELKKINQDLLRINNELDQFVYRSSHDLIAPVKSLKGLVELAQIDKSVQTRDKYFPMIKEQVLQLEGFISDILNYSANTKQEISTETIDFEKLISSSWNKHKYFEMAPKINFKITIQKNGKFLSDERRIGFVIDNLLSNSIKYHNLDQKDPKIEVDVSYRGNNVQMSVSDNGQGIAREHLDRIFNMFYRASNNSSGSGLGLYIAREAAKKLNGTITVTSEYKKGSTFLLTIPNQG